MRYFLVIVSLLLTSCAYVPPTQQGQNIQAEQIQKIEKGMNANQVVAILGTPLIMHPTREGEWIYPYYYQKGSNKVERQYYLVRFDRSKRVREVIYNGERIR